MQISRIFFYLFFFSRIWFVMLCFLVFSNINLAIESLSADIALEWFFAGMRKHVKRQWASIGDPLLTHIAFERLLAAMRLHVTFHTRCLGQHFTAHIANNFRNDSIRMHTIFVYLQLTRRIVSFVTLIAHMRFDAGVCDHVHNELMLDQKTFLARFALKWSFAGVHQTFVFQAHFGRSKRFVAGITRKRFGTDMLLHMMLKFDVREKMFVAKLTMIGSLLQMHSIHV